MTYLLISVCAMFVQVVVNKKFWAMFITFFLIDDALPMLGFEHHLWRFASVPEYIYSDIAGVWAIFQFDFLLPVILELPCLSIDPYCQHTHQPRARYALFNTNKKCV